MDDGGWTPLHKASLHGKLEAVQFLLSHGAKVNCRVIFIYLFIYLFFQKKKKSQ